MESCNKRGIKDIIAKVSGFASFFNAFSII